MNVLVVAAHPDDEVLGCGATMARHADAGDHVEVVILGTGALSRPGSSAREVAELRDQAQKAASVLGVRGVRLLDLPDNRFDSVDLLDIVQRVEAEMDRVDPEVVYTHHASDLNVDHRRTFEAVLTACRPPSRPRVRRLLSFEIPSSTEWQAAGVGPAFAPTVFVDATATLPRKLQALDAYRGEMRPAPHPRSAEAIQALAAWRGATAAMHAAEAFVLVRERS